MEIPGSGRLPGLAAETFQTGHHLANARRRAEAGIDGILVIDADAHVYEKESIAEIIPLIEDPIVRQLARSAQGAARQAARFPLDRVAYHDLGGRITRDILRRLETTRGRAPTARPSSRCARWMRWGSTWPRCHRSACRSWVSTPSPRSRPGCSAPITAG